MINLNEALKVRRIGKNPFDFFQMHKIPNGTFVSFGYFNDHAIQFGPKTQKLINQQNDEQLTNYLKGEKLGSTPIFKSKLQAFKDSIKYADALSGKRKTAPLDLDGECHIVKISKFTVNWRDPEHFANFYSKQYDNRSRLRYKYGFGKNEEDYPENDWRRNPKYGGVTLNQAAKGNGGQVYTDPYEDTGIYRSIVDPEKLAIRQILNPKIKGLSSNWFFIDASGNIEYLDKDLMNFLRYNYSNTRVTKEIKDEMVDMSDEEKQFVQELENLKSSELSEKTFLLENIIYMTGVIRKRGEENESFLWRNDDVVSGNFPYFSAQILENIINKVAMADVREVEKLNESILYMKKDNKNALYENIMSIIAKQVKKALNENLQPLNEGQFSWFTQDTHEQIGCEDGNRIHVVMSDLDGNQWEEDDYEGYGVFGGKDYYELMAEMNGFGDYTDDTDILREIGIALEFNNDFKIPGTDIVVHSKNNVFKNPETGELQQILFPALTTDGDGKWYIEHGQKPETDPNQGWIMEEDDEDYWDGDDY